MGRKLVLGPDPLWEHQQDEITRLEEFPRVILAWDMGTGKTRGSIERDLRLRERFKDIKRTLIVAPLGTHPQWAVAIEKDAGFFPHVIDRKDRTAALTSGARYTIVHYDAVRLTPSLREGFDHVIWDECHRIKNRKAKTTLAAKKIVQTRAKYNTAMSGAPADDKPQDFWSILNILWPKSFTSYWKFFDQYVECELVEKQPGNPYGGVYKKVTGVRAAWTTQGLPSLSKVYSRVRKMDVLKNLPPMLYEVREVELHPIQRAHYAVFEKEMLTWVEDQDGELAPLIATAAIAKLQRLQQFALATMNYNAETDKYGMTLPSSKIDAVLEILEDNPTEQLVIFSQFKGPLLLLDIELKKRGITTVMYTGDTRNTRDAGRVSFSQGRTQVFLATIGAGGEGLDGLQVNCDTMIFLDRSWKPKANEQAESRLHRGGQERPVHVINLMAKDTVDFERNVTIERKAEWIRTMLGDKR